MKKIKTKYIKSYKIYMENISKRNHKWGKGECEVCDTIFEKTNGKHYYCSRECRIIKSIYKSPIYK
jgi:hypothetical protein